VRSIEDRLADGQDEIVERIAYQLSAYRPCGATALGPAEITSQVANLVGGFVESLRSRRVAPFVDGVRAFFADSPGSERLACAEVHTALDLLEDLALQSVADASGVASPETSSAIQSLLAAAREVVPRETKCEA
jgi:hypothetical protein